MTKLPSRPYLQMRELKTGLRGRFVPSPKLRQQGYKSFDLFIGGTPYTSAETRHLGFGAPLPVTRTGRPATMAECLKLAEQLATLVNGLTRNPTKEPKPKITITRPAQAITLTALFDDYLRTDKFARLAAATRRDYKARLGHVKLFFPGKRPHDLDEQIIEDMFYTEKQSRGHRSAYGEFQCLRLVMKWGGRNRLWKTYIPHLQWDLGIPAPKARIRIITLAETAALIRAADDPWSIYREIGQNGPKREITSQSKQRPIEPASEMPSIADAITMAEWTAQRPTDTLLSKKHWLVGKGDNMRYQTRPHKTGRRYHTSVDIPVLPPLAARIRQIHKRHLAKGWAGRDHLILSDTMGKPYLREDATQTTFPKAFAKARRLAAKIEPSLADVHFQDYRDTAITRLATAGADLNELRAWSNHANVNSLIKVLKHYMGEDAKFADQAGAKLMAQYEAGG